MIQNQRMRRTKTLTPITTEMVRPFIFFHFFFHLFLYSFLVVGCGWRACFDANVVADSFFNFIFSCSFFFLTLSLLSLSLFPPLLTATGVVSTEERVRKQVLYKLGLTVLLKMQRRDKKEIVTNKKDSEQRRRDEGLASHNAWVKNKNKGMIKMPPTKINPYTGKEVVAKPPPRMDFSGRGVARPKARTVMQNSVDIMSGSGMKYIHAMGFAKQAGQVGDLERSRESLVKAGYVSKKNFVAVNDLNTNDGDIMRDELRRAMEENPALKRREELDDIKTTRNDPNMYDQWAAQKSRSASAVKYLKVSLRGELFIICFCFSALIHLLTPFPSDLLSPLLSLLFTPSLSLSLSLCSRSSSKSPTRVRSTRA